MIRLLRSLRFTVYGLRFTVYCLLFTVYGDKEKGLAVIATAGLFYVEPYLCKVFHPMEQSVPTVGIKRETYYR